MTDPSKVAPTIYRVDSATHAKLEPGAFFEWHTGEHKVFCIRPKPGTSLRRGVVVAENIRTPMEARMVIAAYVQGIAHTLRLAELRDGEDAVSGVGVPRKGFPVCEGNA